MEARRDSRENTELFSFFYSPSFSAQLPGCYNVKLVFLSAYREPQGTAAWRQRRGKWFWREAEEETDEEQKEENGIKN